MESRATSTAIRLTVQSERLGCWCISVAGPGIYSQRVELRKSGPDSFKSWVLSYASLLDTPLFLPIADRTSRASKKRLPTSFRFDFSLYHLASHMISICITYKFTYLASRITSILTPRCIPRSSKPPSSLTHSSLHSLTPPLPPLHPETRLSTANPDIPASKDDPRARTPLMNSKRELRRSSQSVGLYKSRSKRPWAITTPFLWKSGHPARP